MNQTLSILLTVTIFISCSLQYNTNVEELVTEYYKIYDERQDFESFINFYDENVVFEDVINGDKITGKEALTHFFDWKNPDFIKVSENNLVVLDRIIQGNKAVIKGYFTEFRWDKMEVEAMHFTTILIFNDSQKIIRQVDWINYPASLVDYNNRKNSNDWIE